MDEPLLETVDVNVAEDRQLNSVHFTKAKDLKDGRVNVFIPTIFNISLKSVGNVDVANNTATLKFTLAIFLNVNGLTQDEKDHIKSNLTLSLDELELDLSKAIRTFKGPHKDTISIIYRGEQQTYFHLERKQLRYLPFDQHWMNVKFIMGSVNSEDERTAYRFNCLAPKSDLKRDEIVIQFRPNYDRVPEWNIAIGETKIRLGGEKKAGLSYNNEVVVGLLLYREPEYLLYITVVPLILLNLCTLAMYGLGADDYSDKLGILVTLLLAMFAFIPTIRDNIPKVPFITFLDLQLFFSIALIFVGLVETVLAQFMENKEVFGGVHLACLGVSVFVFIISIASIGMLWYPFKMICRRYNRESKMRMGKFVEKAGYKPESWEDVYVHLIEGKDEKQEYGLIYLWQTYLWN